MKGALVFIFSVLTTLAFTQNNDNSDHLTFKGCPIDGTLNTFVEKLKQTGLKHEGTENGIASLSGDFAGYKDCYVGMSTLEQKDLVYKISVIFPECKTWSCLESNYRSLQNMLSVKYGKPDESEAEFESPYVTDDRSKFYEVLLDRCKYYSLFNIDKGDIVLAILYGEGRCFVSMLYLDKINAGIIESESINDL